MIRRLVPIALVLIVVAPAVALGQRAGVAVTPYIGLAWPGKQLLLRPGLNAATDAEKQAVYGLIGGRVGVGLTPSLELQGDLGYGSSGLKIASLSAPSGTNASVVTMSAELAYRTKPPVEPLSVTLHGGVGAVHRSFAEKSGTPTAISNGTNVGAILGIGFNFRSSRRTAVVLGIDDFIYNASFKVAATGSQAAGTTKALTQNDVRVSVGVRVSLLGQ